MPMSNNGRAKLVEEFGEALQVVGKIDGMGGDIDTPHWDGKGPLRTRLEDELADSIAAIQFAVWKHGLDDDRIVKRAEEKLALFQFWDEGDS
jgi:NTP pyrophosphatase (non-canonical NTP hydrolase)